MDAKAKENNRLRQKKFLDLHRDEVNEARRARYHERISAGKCPRCGGRIKKGHVLCTACCEYMIDINRRNAKRNKTAPKPKAAVKPKSQAPKKAR
jgi:hypothetical protein